MRLLELSKKKEELDKKSKKAEMKKKKNEEGMKKMLDEEVEKRNAQRKALEESFWARVKHKGKDKPVERLNLNIDRREDEQLMEADGMPSVESAKSHPDPSESPLVGKTHHSFIVRHKSHTPIKEIKSSTLNNFSKEPVSPLNSADADGDPTKMGRQKSVDDMRSRRKEDNINLPYIDTNKNKARTSIEVALFAS